MFVACIQTKANSVHEYREAYDNILRMAKEAGAAGANMAVLPECVYPAYYLGFDMDTYHEAMKLWDDLLGALKEIAADFGMYIAFGAATKKNGKIFNSVIMLDDEGKEIAWADKSNMWHFDSQWFDSAENYGIFDTKYGKVGMIICADGRLVEICRILALAGAQIIIDVANLTAAAADYAQLTNQQYQFILPVRAAENGLWMVVSDKVGLEAGCASYLGRSMIIDPDGNIVQVASSDKQEIIYHEIDFSRPPSADLPQRKPLLYGILAKENAELPIVGDMETALIPSSGEVFTSPIMFRAANAEEYLAKARHYISCCRHMGCKIQVLPQSQQELCSLIEELLPQTTADSLLMVVGLEEGVKTAAALWDGKILDKWRKTHSQAGEKVADGPFHCCQTPFGKIALIFDQEGYVPEIARAYMLLGCNILLWSDSVARPMDMKVMRSRAAENKIFVVRNSCAPQDCGAIADTEGRLLTCSFRGEEQSACGMINYLLSLAKTVVPGTDIVKGRKNSSYLSLTI